MKKIEKITWNFLVSVIVTSILSFSTLSEEVTMNDSTWHIIHSAATSTPIFIEKSPDPSFGKKRERKKRVDESSEEFVLLQPFNSTATSTPFSIHEEDDQSIRPLRFNFSVIKNTCTAVEGSWFAEFEVCNEEPHNIQILELVFNPFAKMLSPHLPVTVKVDACRKISIGGNDKNPFDCSGIYAVSFDAQIENSKYTGHFGAGIIK